MGPTTLPPSMAELDASFVFEGAYRSRGSMTLAERASYGLRDEPQPFVAHMRYRALGPDLAPVFAGTAEHRQNSCFETARPLLRTQASSQLAITCREIAPSPLRRAATAQCKPPRRQRTSSKNDVPIHFTLRLSDRMVEGIVLAGRIFAVRQTTRGCR